MSKEKQTQRILEFCQKWGAIDRIRALQRCGVIELSARIVELEREGYEFEKGWIKRVNQFNEKYKLRTYKLIAK
jgi:hypothetical protein